MLVKAEDFAVREARKSHRRSVDKDSLVVVIVSYFCFPAVFGTSGFERDLI